MKKVKLLLFIVLMLTNITLSFSQVSRTIHVSEPGTLYKLLGKDVEVVTNLTLTGNINYDDLGFVSYHNYHNPKSAVRVLDLENTIYKDERTGNVPLVTDVVFDKLILPNNITTETDGILLASVANEVVIPRSLKSLEIFALQSAIIGKIDFSQATNLETIGHSAFGGFTNSDLLIDLSKCSALKEILSSAFESNICTVILPNHLTKIDREAFIRFNGEVKLPASLISIEEGAFGLAGIRKIGLPAGLQQIDQGAFMECEKLSLIYCSSLVPPRLGEGVFYGLDKKKITLVVPYDSYNLYKSTPEWKDFNIKIKDGYTELRSSINQKNISNNITIYPNPVTDILNIGNAEAESIEVYNINGRLAKKAQKTNSIDVSALSNGIYIVKIMTASGPSSFKITKK